MYVMVLCCCITEVLVFKKGQLVMSVCMSVYCTLFLVF